jgi:RNA polymerase sigma factor (sigma-70 family)
MDTERAFRTQLEANKGRIFHLVIPFSNCGVDQDDLVQEATLAFWKSFQNWDPSKGAELWTFARPRVFGALVDLTSKEIEKPSLPNYEEDILLDLFDSDGAPIAHSSFEEVLLDFEEELLTDKAIASLPLQDRQLISLWLASDTNFHVMAKHLHCDPSVAGKRVREVIRQIRALVAEKAA